MRSGVPERVCACARANVLGLVLAGICASALLWQAQTYLPFFVDDSFIALRYVWRLVHGRGLTWTDGERVEGYSDLLWILLVAAGEWLRVAVDSPVNVPSLGRLVDISRATGIACTVAAVLAVIYAHAPRRLRDTPPALAGGVAMVLTSPVVAWSIGGLEQPLLSALVAWAVVAGYRIVDGRTDRCAERLLGFLLGLASLARPDGVLFTVTTCAGVFLASGATRQSGRVVLRVAALASAFAVAQLAFRRIYYGTWVPNTAHVKLAFNATRVTQGWRYVAGAEPYLGSLYWMAVVGAALAMTHRRSRRRVALPMISAAGWTSYVVAIGGDISPARRHLVVPIVLLSLVIVEGLHALATRSPAARGLAWAAAVGGLVLLARAERDDPEKRHALNDTWPWSGLEVGRFLSRAFFVERPLVAVDAAGALPYFAPELPCLDMLGLNDRFLATHHPPEFGKGFIGHELGNGDYILARKPDLIAFGTALGGADAHWRGGLEMRQDPEFTRRYTLVSFETPEGVGTRLWVRSSEGRIGIQRSDREVVVPGHLLASAPSGLAVLDAEGRIGARLDAAHAAQVGGVGLGPGRWLARVEASGRVRTIAWGPGLVPCGDGAVAELRAQSEVCVADGDDAQLTVTVALVDGQAAHVRRVLFRRE
ncbi:MAG: hypothetical protein M3O50_14125 [Myxococcota bacterium]|nr:hypothetical protein [Myxococcota bacterium]